MHALSIISLGARSRHSTFSFPKARSALLREGVISNSRQVRSSERFCYLPNITQAERNLVGTRHKCA